MGRKKKVEEPMPVVSPVKEVNNGSGTIVDPEILKVKALEWAIECGFAGEIVASDPEREDFPKWGYGYVVMVHEKAGKKRRGSARFTHEGVRNFWQMDGMITG